MRWMKPASRRIERPTCEVERPEWLFLCGVLLGKLDDPDVDQMAKVGGVDLEQQLRAVCGLPLGSPSQVRPAAMVNLLGDLWASGEPDWAAALAMPDVALHLYGKSEPRPGRKMGHLTALGGTVDEAVARAIAARDVLA